MAEQAAPEARAGQTRAPDQQQAEQSELQAEQRRVAVVTGGSRGVGRAVVEALAEHGWRVFFASRNPDSVTQAAAELAARFGEKVSGRPIDVRRQEEVDGLFGWVEDEAGRIDCLVNNAGLGTFGPVDALSGDQWREVLETNLYGAFYCIRAAAPIMKRQGDGWIFNIGSLAGKNAFAGGAAYNASKFGLIGLSEAAMLDLRGHGVRVAAILPGSIDSGFRSPRDGAAGHDWMLLPADVAAMVLHLLSYPPRVLPSLIEMRPTRPPSR
ncbi:MAG TPA: SDR family oxidoreductase [Thermoanaerobaculia bacterium]|nr:SDR family oxidoreductase [Thermoanaerobaculia bacterium]